MKTYIFSKDVIGWKKNRTAVRGRSDFLTYADNQNKIQYKPTIIKYKKAYYISRQELNGYK
jgi:hypothetical protein